LVKASTPQKRLKNIVIKVKNAANRKAKNVSKLVRFPIVGIGASAGGLEALRELISNLPLDTGMAFILIQHLDPSHKSMSPDILARNTKMPVQEVEVRIKAKPNNIYIIPPNHNMEIKNGFLNLLPRTETRGQHLTINFFFKSLAAEKKAQAVGVVLSGTASDGAEGIKSIKALGGLVIAQDPKTAKFDGMPRSAIETGVVDFILSPKAIASELARFGKHPYKIKAVKSSLPAQGLSKGNKGNKGKECREFDADTKYDESDESDLGDERDVEEKQEIDQSDHTLIKIFSLLKQQVKVDFSTYKHSTLKRRIQRRMIVQKAKTQDAYFKYLKNHPVEVRALFADLLIHVTQFFREPGSFKALETQVFPKFLADRNKLAPVRVWVPGCSTGEEAYSLAIVLIEFLSRSGCRTPIQIFATDISEAAIKKARMGIYPDSIKDYVSTERLSRFFDKIEKGYKIKKAIRDLCLFSIHDLTVDPPFAKLDLISCRNVLIYFSSLLQKRVLPIFHYALNPNGHLILGKSESPAGFSEAFIIKDKTNKIYSKLNIPAALSFKFHRKTLPLYRELVQQSATIDPTRNNFQTDADQIAHSKYIPSAVVINSDLEVLQIRGRIAPYLEAAPGLMTNHLMKMARVELQSPLRLMIHSASKNNKPARKEGITFKVDGKLRAVNIEVIPTNTKVQPKERNYIIFFEEVVATSEKSRKRSKKNLGIMKSNRISLEYEKINSQLESELTEIREYQRTASDEFESSKEELTSANEELQSTNEEAQSTNEELETAKEELQSSNEEMSTLNDELQLRNTELTFLGSDLNNLLSSSEIPIVFVGSDHRIRRFTPKAEAAFKLIPSDVGRHISDIKTNFELDLEQLVTEVIESLTSQSKEIQDVTGKWLRVQVKPYRTIENNVEGAVIAVLDIDSLKQRLTASEIALKYSLSVADTVSLPLVIIDKKLRLLSANRSFLDYFRASTQPMGMNFFDFMGVTPHHFPELYNAIEQSFHEDRESKKFELDYEFPVIGYRALLISAKKVQLIESQSNAVLIALLDITDRKRIERELALTLKKEKEARKQADEANRAKDMFLATLSHELRTPLTTISLWAQMLRQGKIALDSEAGKNGLAAIDQSAETQGQLINDLLDVSRIIMGKISLELCDIEPAPIIWLALDSVRMLAAKKSIHIESYLDQPAGRIAVDPIRFQQVIWNLLTNAIKFSSQGGRIEVRLECVKESQECARITITDFGKGISHDFLPHIFERFSQADSSSTRVHGGLGLGLAIVSNLVELQLGSVKVESAGIGKGSKFTVTFPLIEKTTLKEDPCTPETVDESTIKQPATINKDFHTLEGLRVLVVEDDSETRAALSAMLTAYGAKIQVAASAREGFAIFHTFTPQVLISDVAMPIEDGYAFIQKIRALAPKDGGAVPALALTAYAGHQDIKRAISAGFQIHMSKPVVGTELINVIARLAGRLPNS
jgi:two-component system CheB/CheR fusion protein